MSSSVKTRLPGDKAKGPEDNIPKRFEEQDRHFSLVRNFYVADVITIMNGVCGVMSVFSSMRYLLSMNLSDLYLAMMFIPFGLLFDFLDGRVARWRKNSSLLGQELDSLADLISFGVAPAVLAFAVGMRTYLDTVVLTYFVCCGIARLARFNATVALQPKDASGKVHYFEGTPIPTSLTIVAILAYFVTQGRYLQTLPGQSIELAPSWDLHPLVLTYAVNGTLMVSWSQNLQVYGRFCSELGLAVVIGVCICMYASLFLFHTPRERGWYWWGEGRG